MGLKASTIKTMHAIAGEEALSTSPLWMLALQAQTMIDPSLWVRRVDIALIGGDPIILSRRISQILRQADPASAPRIAVLHPGVFSGAPLAALEDPDYRAALGLSAPQGVCDTEAPAAIMRAEVERAAGLLTSRGRGGVLAFEMVQGLFDPAKGETVLRLTRDKGRGRQQGVRASADPISQIEQSTAPRGADLYARSERLFTSGLGLMDKMFSQSLTRPPRGRRFADLILSAKCEILSGFISPPTGRTDGLKPDEIHLMAGDPYQLAGAPPKIVSQAVDFWRQDFGRATNGPISSL